MCDEFQVSEDEGPGGIVISTLTFAPVPEDHGKTLKCRGENPALPVHHLEDSFHMNVVCEYFLFSFLFLL